MNVWRSEKGLVKIARIVRVETSDEASGKLDVLKLILSHRDERRSEYSESMMGPPSKERTHL